MTGFGSIRRRQFVAIATAKFEADLSYLELPEVADEVELITAWLTDEKLGERRFTKVYHELAADPDFEQIQARLRNPSRDERWNRSDAAVVYITGHGDIRDSGGRTEHYLVLNKTDGTRLKATGLATSELLGWLADTDIEYLLVIIDVCFAGLATEELTGSARDHWLILPSAMKDQGAEPGALAKAISGYLKTAEEFNTHAPYLTVGVFVDALNELLPPDQKIEKIYQGKWPGKGKDRDHDRRRHVCLPNPSYQPRDELLRTDPARQPLALPEGLLRLHNRVNGQPPSAEHPGWLFTGRERLMQDLILAAGTPGITMVTGSAGSGKSIALSRLVTLSDSDFRRSYEPELAGVPADLLPSRGVVDVALSARALSNRQVVTQICHNLGTLAYAGSWDDPVRANLEALSEFIAWSKAPVTIVLDALDEAEDPADLVRSVLGPLRQKHPERLCLIVGVRSPSGDDADAEELGGAGEPRSGLMAAVPEVRRIQADDDVRWRRRDFTTFVRNILTNTADSPYRNADRVAVNRVAEVISTLAGRSYLMAGVAASSAAERPDVVAPDDPAWLDELKGGLLGVFRGDLQASLPPSDWRRGVTLLRAVAFGRGTGLPRHQVWPRVATAVAASDGAARDYGDTDVRWLLDESRLNAYLLADHQDDLTVYRLIHDELRDTLRYRWRDLLKKPAAPGAKGHGNSPPTDEEALPRAEEAEIRAVEARIARELHSLAEVEPTVATDEAVPPYIRRHFGEHALDGGVLDRYVPIPFLPYLDLARLRATAGAFPARRQLEENVPWLPVIRQVTHLWDWNRPARNAAAISMWAALNETRLPGSAAEPGPVGGLWRVQWAIKPPDMGNVLGHHKEMVRATATAELSGEPIAVTGGEDGRLHVWDLSTGAHYRDREPIDTQTWDDKDKAILCVTTALLPNGRTVAVTGSADGAVRIWDLGSGRALGDPLGVGGRAIEAVTTAVLPDKRVVVTTATGETVRTWNLVSQEPIGVPVPCGPGMALGLGTALVGERVLGLATGEDSGLDLWDLATGIRAGDRLTGHPLAEQPATGTMQGGRVIAAVILSGREVAITGNGDGLLLWDLREQAPINRRLRGGDGSIRSLAVAQLDGQVMAVTGGSRTVQVWNLDAGEPVGKLLTGHDGSVEALAIAGPRDGTAFAVSGSRDKSIRIWDVPGAALSLRRPVHQIGIVEAVATARSADGRALAITCSHTSVQVWDLERGGEPGQLTRYDSPVVSVAAAGLPEGVLVAAGHWDGWISAWWAAGGIPVSGAEIGDLGAAASLAMAKLADRRLVVVAGGWDGNVRVWNPFAGTSAGEPLTDSHTDVVVAVATASTADGRTLVISGSKDGHVLIRDLSAHLDPGLPTLSPPVDVDTGEEITSLTVAVLAGGRPCVVVGGEDGTVRLLNLIDGAVVGPSWLACSGAVAAVAAGQLADGRAVVFTGGEESLVQAWDADTGEATGEALPMPGPVLAMAFQTELSHLVVGGTGIAVARLRHGGR